jgi:hypothetical protein
MPIGDRIYPSTSTRSPTFRCLLASRPRIQRNPESNGRERISVCWPAEHKHEHVHVHVHDHEHEC